MDLPKILLTGLFFFWFSSSFWTVGFGTAKTSRKTKQTKKNNPEWTYPRLFSQDCFFCFPRVFGQLGLGQQKTRKKTNKPKKPS